MSSAYREYIYPLALQYSNIFSSNEYIMTLEIAGELTAPMQRDPFLKHIFYISLRDSSKFNPKSSNTFLLFLRIEFNRYELIDGKKLHISA